MAEGDRKKAKGECSFKQERVPVKGKQCQIFVGLTSMLAMVEFITLVILLT